GCNQGACHGKSRGQNGFQLSLLAFDPDFDYAALTQQARGRRVFPAAPERSLILQKASAVLPHGGGVRLEPGSADYETVLRWIAEGASRRVENEPKLLAVAVGWDQRAERAQAHRDKESNAGVPAAEAALSHPTERFLQPGGEFQLAVTATYSDGSTR